MSSFTISCYRLRDADMQSLKKKKRIQEPSSKSICAQFRQNLWGNGMNPSLLSQGMKLK